MGERPVMSDDVPLMDDEFYEEIPFLEYTRRNAVWDVHASGPYVYIAVCAEDPSSASALLFRYDTRTGEKRMVLDTDKVAGIDLSTGIMPQSKFHTAIRTMKDGRLFMVTHNTASGFYHPTWAVHTLWHDPTGFNSRAFTYDPESDVATYLGTPVPNEDFYYGQIDREWNLYYAYGCRCGHIYVIDLDTMMTTEIATQPGAIGIVVDDDHMVYTSDRNQRIWRWDPVKKKSTMTGLRMPHGPYMKESTGSWVYGWKDKDGWIYGVPQGCNRICRFKPNEGIMEDLGNGWIENPESPGSERLFGVVRAPNGKIYYSVYGTARRYQGAGDQWMDGADVIELDPETKQKRYLGTFHVSDGTNAAIFGEAAVGADGRVYWGDGNHGRRGTVMWAFDPSKLPDEYTPTKSAPRVSLDVAPSESWTFARPEQPRRLYRFRPLLTRGKLIEFKTDTGFKRENVESVRLPEDAFPLWDNAVVALAAAPDGKLYGIAGRDTFKLFSVSPDDLTATVLGTVPSSDEMFNGSAIISTPKGMFYGGDNVNILPPDGQSRTFKAMKEDERAVALAYDAQSPCLYVLTEPANVLYVLSAESGEQLERFEIEGYVVSRWLAAPAGGGVYGFGNNASAYRVDADLKMRQLDSGVPTFKGTEFIAEVTSAAGDGDGKVWGGTREGYLFSIDPEDDRVVNRGKPGTYYLKGVTPLGDSIYSFGGGDFGATHLHRYREADGFEDLGMVTQKLVNAAVAGADGRLYAGEYSSASSIVRMSVE